MDELINNAIKLISPIISENIKNTFHYLIEIDKKKDISLGIEEKYNKFFENNENSTKNMDEDSGSEPKLSNSNTVISENDKFSSPSISLEIPKKLNYDNNYLQRINNFYISLLNYNSEEICELFKDLKKKISEDQTQHSWKVQYKKTKETFALKEISKLKKIDKKSEKLINSGREFL